MMTTADIGFSTDLLPERRLVWERIVYATFLLRIFCFAKRSTFPILKSRLGSITELLIHEPLDSIWSVFSKQTTNMKFIFVTSYTKPSLKTRYGHILIRFLLTL